MIKLLPTVVEKGSHKEIRRGMFNIVWQCFISHSTNSCMKMSSLLYQLAAEEELFRQQ